MTRAAPTRQDRECPFRFSVGGVRPAARSILAGKPIVAYLPNVAADGSHDWVRAVGTSVTERFLSIALKPSTHSLEPVATRYQQLQQTEADAEAAREGKKAAVDKARAS